MSFLLVAVTGASSIGETLMLTSETCIVHTSTTIDDNLQRRILSKNIELDWRADSKKMVLQPRPYQGGKHMTCSHIFRWTHPTCVCTTNCCNAWELLSSWCSTACVLGSTTLTMFSRCAVEKHETYETLTWTLGVFQNSGHALEVRLMPITLRHSHIIPYHQTRFPK